MQQVDVMFDGLVSNTSHIQIQNKKQVPKTPSQEVFGRLGSYSNLKQKIRCAAPNRACTILALLLGLGVWHLCCHSSRHRQKMCEISTTSQQRFQSPAASIGSSLLLAAHLMWQNWSNHPHLGGRLEQFSDMWDQCYNEAMWNPLNEDMPAPALHCHPLDHVHTKGFQLISRWKWKLLWSSSLCVWGISLHGHTRGSRT